MNVAAQIFLSYAREDEEQAEDLYQRLSDAGLKPWMDKKDILPGERWKSSIRKAIQGSDFFLACLSANSVTKRGFLQKEIKDALDVWEEMLDSDIYLIPARLQDCEVPKELREFQWVDLFEANGWTRLVEAIQVGMERRGIVSEPEEEWLSHYAGLADDQILLQHIEEILRDGLDALRAQLVDAKTWRQPEAESPPESLAAFVSLDESEREAAVRSVQLASLDDVEKRLYAQVLMGMLRDESYVVVWEAVKSLQHVDTSLASEALLEVCRTREDEIVYQALEALGQLGDRDTMFLLDELKTLIEDLPVLQQAGDGEERQNFLQAVEEAKLAISERLPPSPDTYAKYGLKE